MTINMPHQYNDWEPKKNNKKYYQYEFDYKDMPHRKEKPESEQQWQKVPKIDFVEFGRAFEIPALISDQGIQAAYQMAVEDFLREKMTSFPDWDGLPQIKINASKDYGQMISGGKQLGWYVKVPKKYVLTEDDKIQKLDEELWDS